MAAVGQAAIPTLLAPRFEPDEQPPNVLQPAPITFGVWLPIFATSLAHARFQSTPTRREDHVLRDVGWPAVLAYAVTATWAPLVRARRFWSAQGALFVLAAAAEVARRRLAEAEASGGVSPDVRRTVAPPVGMLAAWGAAAAAVNLGSMVVHAGLVPTGRAARTTGVILTSATATLAVAAAMTARGGSATSVGRIYLATVAWALGGIVAGQWRRAPVVAAGAAAGLLPIAGLLAANTRPAG